MKKSALLMTVLILITGSFVYSENNAKNNESSQKSPVQVMSTPELAGITSNWISAYSAIHPEASLLTGKGTGNILAEIDESGEGIAFVPANLLESNQQEIWKMVVGRDVVVPVINANNPYLAGLKEQGVTPDELISLFTGKGQISWSNLISGGQANPVNVYLADDPAVLSIVGQMAGMKNPAEANIILKNETDIIKAIQGDPYGIAFCRVASISKAGEAGMIENISLLPLDKNANGRIEYMESIYDNLDQFARGVWIGKYPKALYNDVYCVAKEEPKSESEIAFIKWVLTDGQEFLPMNGLCDLVYGERQSKLAKFDKVPVITPSSRHNYFLTPLIFIILGAALFLGLLISVIVYHRKNKDLVTLDSVGPVPFHFSDNSLEIPKGLYYGKTHTWAFMEKDGMVKVGIDDFLQHVTGPISRLEMRKAGEKVRKGDVILSIIQNGKRLTVYSPVSGTIIDNNKKLASDSSDINTAPYTDGWVYRIEPTNWLREIQFLDMAEKYRSWLNNEFLRLKDFLAGSLRINKVEYERVILQDGGVLKDNILEEFGPHVWEDFQVHFLDMGKNA
jgi:glycine cleavage system H lipoate-binding protein/ABC-type phosphate transport system substrate-binding protein